MGHTVAEQFQQTRRQTLALCENLNAEDMLAQSMPDASPAKWHLAHTTWFFETFILNQFQTRDSKRYTLFDEQFPHLFNSYYVSAGTRYQRPQRGLLTRPALPTVLEYRRHVDEHMLALLDHAEATPELHSEISKLVTVGLHHEMQHQELLLTDILHVFSLNPLNPAVFSKNSITASQSSNTPSLKMVDCPSELVSVGANSDEFSYDCERPKHQTYLTPFKLANRLTTNGEWLQFMQDNGYSEPLLWLSDGWACREKNDWQAPLYWQHIDGTWFQFGLDGLQKIDLDAPVSHISYYEAEAFARWAGKRLPREHELESVTDAQIHKTGKLTGNFVESKIYRPTKLVLKEYEIELKTSIAQIHQLYGDVWEWTQSAFLPYPKFKAELGALGEYNGKFMVNQFVLKGGSCATSALQMRSSYRNFFYPFHRWQFSGCRLAEDI